MSDQTDIELVIADVEKAAPWINDDIRDMLGWREDAAEAGLTGREARHSVYATALAFQSCCEWVASRDDFTSIELFGPGGNGDWECYADSENDCIGKSSTPYAAVRAAAWKLKGRMTAVKVRAASTREDRATNKSTSEVYDLFPTFPLRPVHRVVCVYKRSNMTIVRVKTKWLWFSRVKEWRHGIQSYFYAIPSGVIRDSYVLREQMTYWLATEVPDE